MASSLDQERIEFESHAGQMSLEQLTESLKANEKLIQLFELQKGAIPQVLEMMQTVLKQELEKSSPWIKSSGLPPLFLKFDHSTTLVLLEANLHDSLQ